MSNAEAIQDFLLKSFYSIINSEEGYAYESFFDSVGTQYVQNCDSKLLCKILTHFPHDIQYVDINALDERMIKLCIMQDASVIKKIEHKIQLSPELIFEAVLHSKHYNDLAFESLDISFITKERALQMLKTNYKLWNLIPQDILTKEEYFEGIREYHSDSDSNTNIKKKEDYGLVSVKLIPKEMMNEDFILLLIEKYGGLVLKVIDKEFLTQELLFKSIEITRGTSIAYIDKPSFEMRLKALDYHWDVFSLFDNPSPEERQKYEELRKLMPNENQRFLTPLRFANNFNQTIQNVM